jgi:hypothetical protein
MKDKLEGSKQYWSVNSKHIKTIEQESEEFRYEEGIDSLQRFNGAHPKVMQARLNALNWHPQLSTKMKKFNTRYFMLYWFEKIFNYRPFENKHFIEFKEP